METIMPELTRWQFYALITVQAVLGILLCVAMYYLGVRNDAHENQRNHPKTKWIANKMAYLCIIIAGITSYLAVPDLYDSFINDISDKAASAVTNTIFGSTSDDAVITEDAGTPVWGNPNQAQNEIITLMGGFWFHLGFAIYFFCFNYSNVSIGKKLLKLPAYLILASIILLYPKEFHYFRPSEFGELIIMLILSGVLIALTHDFSRKQSLPPIPGQLNGQA